MESLGSSNVIISIVIRDLRWRSIHTQGSGSVESDYQTGAVSTAMQWKLRALAPQKDGFIKQQTCDL